MFFVDRVTAGKAIRTQASQEVKGPLSHTVAFYTANTWSGRNTRLFQPYKETATLHGANNDWQWSR